MNTFSFAKNAAVVCAAGGLLWANGTLAARVEPRLVDTKTGMSQAQQNRMEQIASASLFGQFRSSMADFLWLKVDKYLHSGVDLRGTTKSEQESAAATDKVVSAQGEDGNRAHRMGEETTVVPSKARDWRGPLGDIERAIQPYQDMEGHKHRDAKEALPLFRLMTLSNPHFVPGYVVGGAMIARDHSKFDQAAAFLTEGAKNNPESIEIEMSLGELLTAKKRDFLAGLPHLDKAIRLGFGRDFATLTEDEREAWQNAFRWMVLNRREAGDPAAARKAAEAGIALFPQDAVCRRYLQENKDKK